MSPVTAALTSASVALTSAATVTTFASISSFASSGSLLLIGSWAWLLNVGCELPGFEVDVMKTDVCHILILFLINDVGGFRWI